MVQCVRLKHSNSYNTSLNQIIWEFGNSKNREIIFNVFEPIDSIEVYQFLKKTSGDLILCLGSITTKFLNKKFEGKNKTPIVTVCAKNPELQNLRNYKNKKDSTNFAYTSLNINPKTRYSYLKKAFPNLKTIYVLYTPKNQSSINTQLIPLEETTKEFFSLDSMQIKKLIFKEYWNVQYHLRNTFKKLSNAQKKESILLILGSTSIFNHIQNINQIADLYHIPVISVTPSHVTSTLDDSLASAGLAIGVSFNSNAKLAYNYMRQILFMDVKPWELPLAELNSPDISINFMRLKPSKTKIPFSLFENANNIYDRLGQIKRSDGVDLEGH